MSRIIRSVDLYILAAIGFENFSRRQYEKIDVKRVNGGVWNCGFRNEVGAIEFKKVCRRTGVRAAGRLWPSGNRDEDVTVRQQRSRGVLSGHATSIGSF